MLTFYIGVSDDSVPQELYEHNIACLWMFLKYINALTAVNLWLNAHVDERTKYGEIQTTAGQVETFDFVFDGMSSGLDTIAFGLGDAQQVLENFFSKVLTFDQIDQALSKTAETAVIVSSQLITLAKLGQEHGMAADGFPDITPELQRYADATTRGWNGEPGSDLATDVMNRRVVHYIKTKQKTRADIFSKALLLPRPKKETPSRQKRESHRKHHRTHLQHHDSAVHAC